MPSKTHMVPSSHGASGLLAGAQEWWRLAGLAEHVGEEPVRWLVQPAEPAAQSEPDVAKASDQPAAPIQARKPARPGPASPPAHRLGGDQGTWPQTLDAFSPWWLNRPELDDGGSYPRVQPEGPAQAELALFAPMPCAHDSEHLFEGDEGRLLRSFAQAAGAPWHSTYRGTVLPRHTLLPDWPALADRGLADILVLHLRLASPRRVVVFGKEATPLLQGVTIPYLLAPSVDELCRSPLRRKRFWERWLQWSGNL